MDTSKLNVIIVHLNKKKVLVFKEIGVGVYYHDIAGNIIHNYDCNCTFLSTISKNKDFYSKKE